MLTLGVRPRIKKHHRSTKRYTDILKREDVQASHIETVTRETASCRLTCPARSRRHARGGTRAAVSGSLNKQATVHPHRRTSGAALRGSSGAASLGHRVSDQEHRLQDTSWSSNGTSATQTSSHLSVCHPPWWAGDTETLISGRGQSTASIESAQLEEDVNYTGWCLGVCYPP